jgi:predicted nucleotidyltransferase
MSDQSPQIDPILTRFRATLDEIYGPRLERVMLYGSRARGDAQEDSDYDVAVFLRDMPDRIAELYRLADLSTAILNETGAFIHAMAYPAGFYNDPRMPLMYAIGAEGIDL